MDGTPCPGDVHPRVWRLSNPTVNNLAKKEKMIRTRKTEHGKGGGVGLMMRNGGRERPLGLCGGSDGWETVTHLMGVASPSCLIDLRLDRVFLGELEVDDHLGGAA
jgi:hypothetical protein